ncbi:MAG: arsenate reductase ArsC [Alphaproteobacteria bacterium]
MKPLRVLFLCTGNSARSVMAEAALNFYGKGRFIACSAGSHPAGAINPYTLDTLKMAAMPTAGLRSKSWDEFAAPGMPALDFVFTVCDNAAGEVCPVWPGQPMSAHWGFSDPAAFRGSETETRAFFQEIFRQIRTRIELFVSLPMASLDRMSLQRRLDEMGRNTAEDRS